MRPGVAAGHPATAEVGAEILADGGTAADAVVAMALASSVAETVYSGLLAGCHAIVFDGTRALNLDGFAAVPAADAELLELPIAFGEEVVTYAIGPASCAVPGLPAALDALWRALGRLPWKRLVEPALAARTAGRPTPADARALARDARRPATRSNGEPSSSRPLDRSLRAGDVLQQPGLVDALEALLAEGAASVYDGAIAEALLSTDGVVLTRDDLARYEARWPNRFVSP